MKKQTIIGILVILAIINVVFAATPTFGNEPALRVTLVNQDPDPAEPGKYVDIRFKFENVGGENVPDVVAELVPNYPFSIEPGDDVKIDVGSVHGRQTGDVGTIIKYRLRVDKNAVEGDDNKIKLKYKFSYFGWGEKEFTIDVQAHQPALSIDAVDVEGKMITPGQEAEVNITLKNTANTPIKDVKVKLKLDGLPIAPIRSSNEKIIFQLSSQESKIIAFNLMPEASAESNVYKVPLEINYLDNAGTRYYSNNTIGIILGSEPDMTTIIESTDIRQAGQKGAVSLKFSNKGLSDIKFLNVKIMPSDDYSLLSPDQEYVGKIESDDYETMDFDLFVKKTEKSEITLKLLLEYKDANNKDYTEDLDLALTLYTSTEAKKYGYTGDGNGFVGIIITVIIIVAGIFIYRRYRKKKIKK